MNRIINESRKKSNNNAILYFSAIEIIISLAFYILSLYVNFIEQNPLLYLTIFFLSIFSFIIALLNKENLFKEKAKKVFGIINYIVFTSTLYFISILIGINDPTGYTVFFVIVLVAMPCVLISSFLITVSIQVFWYIIFVIVISFNKVENVVLIDTFNALVGLIVGVALAFKFHLNQKRGDEYEKYLYDLSMIDELTKINNRHSYQLYIDSLNKTECSNLMYAMIDIDNFKKYNDVSGHLAGDKVLSIIANIIKQAASDVNGFVARVGGEEFALIVKDITTVKAQELLDKINQNVFLSSSKHLFLAKSSHTTVSIGASIKKVSGTFQIENWIKEADLALYDVKSNGKNGNKIV